MHPRVRVDAASYTAPSMVRVRASAWFPAVLASVAWAQDDPVLASGPEPGAPWTKVAVGQPDGSTADAVASFGSGPAAVLFVHELSRNTKPMIRALDRLATVYGVLGFQARTVMLAGDRTAAEQQAQRSSAALGLRTPIAVSADGSEGPGAYALNRKCTLTLVLGKDGKVSRSVAFTDTGEADVPRLEAWIAELTGPLPSDHAGFVRLLARRHPGADAELLDLCAALLVQARRAEAPGARMQQREMREQRPQRRAVEAAGDGKGRDAAPAPRVGKAPDDDQLRALLRAAIQRNASAADLDEVFARVDARVGDDRALRRQAIAMFELMLDLDYGTKEAQERARRWLATHRVPGEDMR